VCPLSEVRGSHPAAGYISGKEVTDTSEMPHFFFAMK
jgi:hypothetical protein